MAELTAGDLDYIRQNSGDDDETENGYEVSNSAIQAIYDSAAQGNGDLDRTVYFVIRRRLGIAARLVSEGSPNTGLNVSKNQKFEQLERLLKLWGDATGLSGARITTGTLSLGLDATEESEWG